MALVIGIVGLVGVGDVVGVVIFLQWRIGHGLHHVPLHTPRIHRPLLPIGDISIMGRGSGLTIRALPLPLLWSSIIHFQN